jgi:hypothetical protein
MAKRVIVLALVVILASYVYVAVFPRCEAADPVKFYLDPEKIDDVGFVPNTTFNVSVKLDNIPADPGLVGIEFNVSWDPTILNGVSMQENIFHEVTPEANWDNIWQIKKVVAANSVNYAFTFQDIDAALAGGYAPISGNHNVANIVLKVVGTGKSSIGFVVHKLGDPSAGSIDHYVVNATFSNVGAPPAPKPAFVFVDPAKISNGSLGVGAVFAVNLKIVNASDVGGLEFKLGFNASALNVQSVVQGAFIPASVTPIVEINNSTGFARFNASLSTPLNGDGALAVVQFQVMAEGVKNSTLHLYDVVLVDSEGATLPASLTADGSFSNLKIVPGDLNHDGIVDIKDAITFSLAYGSTPSDEDWNPEADMDANGEVDMFDMIKIAMNFGKTA